MHSRIMCHRKHRNCDREMRAKMAVGQWHGRVRTWAVGGQATQALTCLCAGSAGCDCSTCVWAEAQGQVGEDRLQGKREQWGCWSTLTCDTGQRICLTECSENPTHQFQHVLQVALDFRYFASTTSLKLCATVSPYSNVS